MRYEVDVVILGGGLAGLSCGCRISDIGKKPAIIEKEKEVGGLCRSFKKDGFIFDLGGHRFLPKNEKLRDFVAELFSKEELKIGKRTSHIYLQGKFLNYPPYFPNILKKLGLKTSFHCLAEGLFLPIKQKVIKKDEVSLQDWIHHRFGKTLFSIYFGPYSKKLWGMEPSKISKDWAPQRIPVSSVRKALLSLIKHKKEGRYARNFLYPTGGIGEIPSRMGKKIRENGGQVLVNCEVQKISEKQGGYLINTINSAGEAKEFFSNNLVSTIPLPEFIKLFYPSPPPEILDAAESLKYRSIRFMNIMIDLPRITENTWLYIPEKEFIFFRIQEFPNWDRRNAPKDQTSLTLEIACDKGDPVWVMEDKELLDICLKDLNKIGIDIKNKILDYFSTYAEHSYPVYSLDYRIHQEKMFCFLESKVNLALCGRQGYFTYINMDKVMESGFEVADSLGKGKKLLRFSEDVQCLEENVRLTE
jgi:protoporphyrinogen oxidase